MVMPTKNLFAVMGLQCGADERQIRNAYRRLAKKLHPDLNPGNPRAGERFKEIAQAYWVLSDPHRRKAYLDANPDVRKEAFESWDADIAGESNLADMAARTKPEAGKDILVRLHLTLEELAAGVMKKVKIRRRQNCVACEGTGIAGAAKSAICPVCRGTGEVPDFIGVGKGDNGGSMPCRKCGGTGVKALSACSVCSGRGQLLEDISINVGVPPGSADREKVVVKDQGHEGYLGGKSGDLRVIIRQKEHPYFVRRGDDLNYYCTVTLSQWLEGCELHVPSLDGPIALKIKSGATPEGALKVRGRGMPQKDGGRGDIIVKYSLSVPEKLSKKQLSLLKRLEETGGFSSRLDERGWCPRDLEKKAAD
jgi:molecular chaperone DnaJ